MMMLQEIDYTREAPRLNLAAWHKPLVSIIITHHNYSDFVGDALASLLGQTYENWECVVVDDASSPEHLAKLEQAISTYADKRIRLHRLTENHQQVRAFFAGLDLTHGTFVCPLDPDDRYAPTYLEEVVATHLNDTVICPVATSDQFLVHCNQVISGCNTQHKLRLAAKSDRGYIVDHGTAQILYFPKEEVRWHWASTSGLMIRRPALEKVRPHGPLNFVRGLDCYIAYGTHVLGGSLVLTRPLVYRLLHETNGWIRNDIYASSQRQSRETAIWQAPTIARDVVAALTANGCEHAARLLLNSRLLKKRSFFARLKRSVQKRLGQEVPK